MKTTPVILPALNVNILIVKNKYNTHPSTITNKIYKIQYVCELYYNNNIAVKEKYITKYITD